MSNYCMLFSQTFYGSLFSYLTITDVTSYVDHTVHLTKSLLQTVLQMLLSQNNNSCTLCVPMFNWTLSMSSKERLNWGFFSVWNCLSVRLKAAGKFYSEQCFVSCYLFLPECAFDDFFFLCSIKKVQLQILDFLFLNSESFIIFLHAAT